MHRTFVRKCATKFTSKVAPMGSARGVVFLQAQADAALKQQLATPSPTGAGSPSGTKFDPLRDVRDFAEESGTSRTAQAADEARRRRLQYQSRYRGMHEMDMIFGAFSADCVAPLSNGEASLPTDEGLISLRVASHELDAYDAILREYDNNLNHWLVEIAAMCVEHGVSVPVEVVEAGKEPVDNIRGSIPARLDANPVWHKLVRYVVDFRGRILVFR